MHEVKTELGLSNGSLNAAWLPYVLEQIDAAGSLSSNWDGYDADPVSTDSGDAAKTFIRDLAAGYRLAQPFVTPTRTGGILFEWEDAASHLEVEIDASQAEFGFNDSASGERDQGGIDRPEFAQHLHRFLFPRG